MAARVVHFDMSAEDPDRMAGFYGTVFGWTCQKREGPAPYWYFQTGPDSAPGINGGIWHREAGPSLQTMNTISVESIDETLAAVADAGGTLVIGKMPIPGVGTWAQIEDTEGNRIGVMQPEQPAG